MAKKEKQETARTASLSDDDLRARRRELEKELTSVKAELSKRNPVPTGRTPRIGGSFPPPLDAARIEMYREVAENSSGPIRDAMNSLCTMVEKYLGQPSPSPSNGSPNPVGRGLIMSLDKEVVEAMDEYVPYPQECEMYRSIFDQLPNGMDGNRLVDEEAKDLRDAAFHLLWFAIELSNDRDPQTRDKVFSKDELEMMDEKGAEMRNGHVPITLR